MWNGSWLVSKGCISISKWRCVRIVRVQSDMNANKYSYLIKSLDNGQDTGPIINTQVFLLRRRIRVQIFRWNLLETCCSSKKIPNILFSLLIDCKRLSFAATCQCIKISHRGALFVCDPLTLVSAESVTVPVFSSFRWLAPRNSWIGMHFQGSMPYLLRRTVSFLAHGRTWPIMEKLYLSWLFAKPVID